MTSYMDDVEVQVGEFACTFRRRLMSEHLGLPEEDVEDPLNDEFIEKMNDITQVFCLKKLKSNYHTGKY